MRRKRQQSGISFHSYWLVCFLLTTLIPFSVFAQQPTKAAEPCQTLGSATLTDGIEDQFAQPSEPTYQGQGIQSLGSGPWAPFDYGSADRQFGHTMRQLPCNIVAATLTLSLKSTSSLSSNDTIALGITNEIPRFRWARRVSDVLGLPWNQSGSTAVLTLDLAALPLASGGTVSVLNLMNANGELDIYFQDDTSVDYIRLDVQTCLGSDCNKNGIDDHCEAEPLRITCPTPITKSLPSRTDECCLSFNLTPVATDLCGNKGAIVITNDYNSAIGGFTDCFPLGTTTIRFTATDARGNQVSCTTSVTVVDDTPPTILFCPEQ